MEIVILRDFKMTKLKFVPLLNENKKKLKYILKTRICQKCESKNWKLIKNAIDANIVICRECKKIFLAGHIVQDLGV